MSSTEDTRNGKMPPADVVPQDDLPGLDDILKIMARTQASDCFISVGAPIKIKVEGEHVVLTTQSIMKDDVDVLLAEGLSGSQMTELDEKNELNCAISRNRVGRFRVSAFVQRNTKSVVIRYIPPDVPSFDGLKLPEILRELIMIKRGLVLVVGPTGSGKSTTLASLIDYRNEHRSDHILTIEDPIEYLHRHKRSVVNQREIGTDVKSYTEALRNAMRQAPDVILIGEIRDQETMRVAMQYAQSGHLVLATLHANNSYHALNRIVGFYPLDNRDALFPDLSSSLRAIISQRLVPDFKGNRLPAVEVLVNSKVVQQLIEQGSINKIAEIMPQLRSDGTQTFEDVLVDMIRRKQISVNTALIYSDSPNNLYWKLSSEGLSINEDTARTAGVDRSAIAHGSPAPDGLDAPIELDLDLSPSLEAPPVAGQPKTAKSASFGDIVLDPDRL